jgi:hypothetical protein
MFVTICCIQTEGGQGIAGIDSVREIAIGKGKKVNREGEGEQGNAHIHAHAHVHAHATHHECLSVSSDGSAKVKPRNWSWMDCPSNDGATGVSIGFSRVNSGSKLDVSRAYVCVCVCVCVGMREKRL